MDPKKSSESDSSFLELQSKTAKILLKLGAMLSSCGLLSFIVAHWNDLSLSAQTGVVTLTMALFYGVGTYTLTVLEKKAAGNTLIILGFFCYGAALTFAEKCINGNQEWSKIEWASVIFLWIMGGLLGGYLLRSIVNLTYTQKLLLTIIIQSLLVFGLASNHLSYKSWTSFPKKELYTAKDAQKSILEEIAADIIEE